MTRPRRWPGFRSVLCAVDFSEHSQRALRYAEAIARREKAALKVIYVNDPLLVTAAAAALHDRGLVKRSATELQAFVDGTIAASSRTRLRLKTGVSTGGPADEILKAADIARADLIVLGTHGLTGADRLFLGSTTLSVLQRTPLPVLAVPRLGDDLTAALPPSWPGKRVIAAIELTGKSADAIETAARVAQWFGSSLLLVHVLTELATPAWMTADLSAHDRIRIARAEQRMMALAALAERRVTTAVRVVCGNISDEIAALAATERAGLLLTCLQDRRRWFGARRGSISYHVLSHAVAPVLAYPPQWQPE